MTRLGWFGLIGVTAIACSGTNRPPPPEQLPCDQDPNCGGALPEAGSDGGIIDWHDRCATASEDDPVSRARLGYFGSDFDIFSLSDFRGTAELYAESEYSPGLACGATMDSEEFELSGTATDAARLRIEPANGNDSFYPTLINQVGFASLPDIVPVFAKAGIDELFDQIAVDRDAARAAIVIEVLGDSGGGGLIRAGGSEFLPPPGGGVVAYKDGDRWRTDLEAATDDGLVAIVNVEGGVQLGISHALVHTDVTGATSELEFFFANGAITFAQAQRGR